MLLATTTSGAPLSMELASPVPIAVVSTGRCLESAAARHPESVQALREAVNDGRAEPCGGRDEDDVSGPKRDRRHRIGAVRAPIPALR